MLSIIRSFNITRKRFDTTYCVLLKQLLHLALVILLSMWRHPARGSKRSHFQSLFAPPLRVDEPGAPKTLPKGHEPTPEAVCPIPSTSAMTSRIHHHTSVHTQSREFSFLLTPRLCVLLNKYLEVDAKVRYTSGMRKLSPECQWTCNLRCGSTTLWRCPQTHLPLPSR
jgi:hypothetical protein